MWEKIYVGAKENFVISKTQDEGNRSTKLTFRSSLLKAETNES